MEDNKDIEIVEQPVKKKRGRWWGYRGSNLLRTPQNPLQKRIGALQFS